VNARAAVEQPGQIWKNRNDRGFSWAHDGAAAPVAAVLRLEPAMRPAGVVQVPWPQDRW